MSAAEKVLLVGASWVFQLSLVATGMVELVRVTVICGSRSEPTTPKASRAGPTALRMLVVPLSRRVQAEKIEDVEEISPVTETATMLPLSPTAIHLPVA